MNTTPGMSGMLAKRIIATILMMLMPAIAAARDYALTLYAGYRDGGNFTDVDTDQSLGLDGSGAVSLALDIGLDTSRQYQIFFSHQQTDLSLNGVPSAGAPEIAMSVSYLHIGGTYFWEGGVNKGPYAVGGIGVTYFDPSDGFDDELRPSLNLGLGYQLPLGKTVALRFEARGYATLVNSNGGLFCSGGCVISISGDVVTQGEVMVGLSTRF